MKTLFIIFSLILIFNQKVGFSQDLDFDSWIFDLKTEARKQGISDDLLDKAFLDVKPIARVLELDRKQPEFTLTLEKYLKNVVTAKRSTIGGNLLATNEGLLRKIEEEFHVPAHVIVALWGIETNFGKHTGSFSVISALTTLAFDGRRSAFFRKELINALKILNDGHVELSKMKGSWAGAMGQCQFMPSTFMQYAIDYNGDGKKDLWGSKEDALASAANYLAKMGWNPESNMAYTNYGPVHMFYEVLAPNNFSIEKGMETEQTLKEWSLKGFKTLDKTPVPPSIQKAKLLALNSEEGKRFFLIYSDSDFNVILKWNRSNFFAIAVGTLANKIIRNFHFRFY